MQKKRDTPSERQLELKFDDALLPNEPSIRIINNVVRVNFGMPRTPPSHSNNIEQVLIERILQNAQKLKW